MVAYVSDLPNLNTNLSIAQASCPRESRQEPVGLLLYFIGTLNSKDSVAYDLHVLFNGSSNIRVPLMNSALHIAHTSCQGKLSATTGWISK